MIPKDIKGNKDYREIMTNLVEKDKQFVGYLQFMRKDTSNLDKERRKKEQEHKENMLFLPLINLSKEMRKKENENLQNNINKKNIIIIDNIDPLNVSSIKQNTKDNNNYYNNTEEPAYQLNKNILHNKLNKDTESKMNEVLNYMNTDINNSILPNINTKLFGNNTKENKLRQTSLYVTNINGLESSSNFKY